MPETLEEIADHLVTCRADPELFVETCFDWKNEPELKGKAPEKWQRAVLRSIRDGLLLNKAVRIAVASGHGIGKTALTLWSDGNLSRLSRHPDCVERSAVAHA
jgi:hypothetical protein